ncbi:MAG: c-type cytochrome [Burkholderiales bacterium]
MRHAVLAALLALSASPEPAHTAGGEVGAQEDSPAPHRQQELIRLVRHDCGSCHGLTLTGGLGPPLDRNSLASKPSAYLQAMILQGRPGTAMPGWSGIVNEDEARWITERLQEGFPNDR